MYSGMHHPLDFLGGVVIGIAALAALVLVCRRRSRDRERRATMSKVAVIAHAGKTLGDGLPDLRRALEERDVPNPFWAEVPKSRKAPKQVERALERGAELVFAWGGDGTCSAAST